MPSKVIDVNSLPAPRVDDLPAPSGAVRLDDLPPPPEEKGFLRSIGDMALSAGDLGLSAAQGVGKFVDKYTGAPVRSGIYAAQEGKNPLSAYANQFGKASDTAPTGKDIVMKAGVKDEMPKQGLMPAFVSEEEKRAYGPAYEKYKASEKSGPTPADVLGLGMDIAADPMLLASGSFKAAKAIPKIGKYVGMAGDAAGEIASDAAKTASKSLVKVGSGLTGIPEETLSNYASKTKKINDMISQHGGDAAEMSDATKGKIVSDIRSTKSGLSKTIGDTLAQAGDTKTLDVKPVLDAIDASKGNLAIKIKANPSLGNQFDDLKSYINNLAENGKVSPAEMHALKEMYQEAAQGSYMKDGQIFQRGKDVQQAAKQAARVSRQIVNDAVPEVAQANNKLAELHAIEDKLNKNIIKPGASDAALAAAGSGANPIQAKLLRRVGSITGTNPLEDAKDFSTARTFANPGLLPMDTTGKAALRTGVGYKLGEAAERNIGIPGLRYAGAALTSPVVTKGLLNVPYTNIANPAFLSTARGGLIQSPNRGKKNAR